MMNKSSTLFSNPKQAYIERKNILFSESSVSAKQVSRGLFRKELLRVLIASILSLFLVVLPFSHLLFAPEYNVLICCESFHKYFIEVISNSKRLTIEKEKINLRCC